MRSYCLLTGATGLVGRYLLRDLLQADQHVAVLVRSSRFETPAERIEGVMVHWEQLAGHALPRPVIIEGDLCEPELGLDRHAKRWLREHCGLVLHNAASMSFREDRNGEPWRTNIQGVANLLEVCHELELRRFHHVSTAYVCGLRTGRILESELDLGQENGNVYERSKLEGEKLVLQAPFLDRVSIYRPASVVGDSRTGYTTSTHGFYLPLQMAHAMSGIIPPNLMGERFFALLGLRGDEGKNLVPVDWLSAAIVRLLLRPDCHGQTYHLTAALPVTVRQIQQVIQEAILRYGSNVASGSLPEEQIVQYEKLFLDYMEIYRSHWRDDPVFDRAATERALADLPCPQLNHDALLRIAAYPVQRNFALRGVPAQVDFWPQECLHAWLQAGESEPLPSRAESIGLSISGRGGGQWRLVVRDGRLVSARLGLGADDAARLHCNAETFASLRAGTLSIPQSLRSGRLIMERAQGTFGARQDLEQLLAQVVSC
jgi:thioester reductase-like protein